MAKNKSSLFSSIKEILSLKPDEEAQERLRSKGVSNDNINNGTVIMESLVEKAAKGEVSAIKEVLSILERGEESQKSNISVLYKALDNED